MSPYSRTRIVATVGPACNTQERLATLAASGASVFRLNFSHGTHDQHQKVIEHIRAISDQRGVPLAILADLCGPKLRLGEVPGDGLEFGPGDEITLTTRRIKSEPRCFHVQIPSLHEAVKEGQTILLDDGLVKLLVKGVRETDVICEVQNQCVIKSRKGVNLPGIYLPIPALTNKDRADLAFALAAGVDLVAMSFVRDAKDILVCRRAMKQNKRTVPLIAKIEKAEAVEALDEIINAADGAMVARGDLGVEIPIHRVPSVQGRIIHACNMLAKPVITATQMLNSMIENPVPTRAEVTDIYNAIMDGTDAVMLSGETAAGKYPVEAVEMMRSVALEAETDRSWTREMVGRHSPQERISITDAVCESAVRMAESLGLDAIICPTATGLTARRISQFRPKCPIFALSTSPETVSRLCLHWGIQSRRMPELWGTEEEYSEGDAIVNETIRTATKCGLVRPGMRVVILAGLPLRVAGNTNFLRVMEVT